MTTDTPVVVGLLVFDDCDALDVVGPYEVLLTANRLREREGLPAPFRVVVVGEPAVTAYGGLGLRPGLTTAECGDLGVLVVPGAIDVDRARPDAAVAALAARSQVVASVCTGAFFLQRLGLVGDQVVTTHWEDAHALRALGATVRDDVRWVDEGSLVTSGGISSGIAMALHLVARYADLQLADACARQIDYVWSRDR